MRFKGVYIIIIIVLLLLPLILIARNNSGDIVQQIKIFQSKLKSQIAPQFSVQSAVPGVSLKLVNTQYLDYVAASLGIFGNQKIVDPAIYREQPESKRRYTISHIRFVLVPTLNQYLVGIDGDGLKKLAGSS